jgi:hypothetical protein
MSGRPRAVFATAGCDDLATRGPRPAGPLTHLRVHACLKRILSFDEAHAIGLRESVNVTGSTRSNMIRTSVTERPMVSVLSEGIIWVAIKPVLARFRRGDHRVTAASCVFACVPVRRRVATPRAAAGLTRSEMHPHGSGLHALLADPPGSAFDGFHRFNMRASTSLSHHGCHLYDSYPRRCQASASPGIETERRSRTSASRRPAAPQDSRT